MAGTVAVTYSRPGAYVKWVQWAWTSSAGGAADTTLTKVLDGKVLAWATNPDDTDAPTDLYDVVVNDTDGVDIAAGGLANRATATSERVTPDPPRPFNGTLEMKVTNAGAAKKGVLTMYYEGQVQP